YTVVVPPQADRSASTALSAANFLISLSLLQLRWILLGHRRGRGRPGRRRRRPLGVVVVRRQVALADVGIDQLVEHLAVLGEDLMEDLGIPHPGPLLVAGEEAAQLLLDGLLLDALRVQ